MVHELTIRYNDQTGDINLTGPIPNKILCYGMLEMAKNAVHDYKAGGLIIPETMPVPVSGGNGSRTP